MNEKYSIELKFGEQFLYEYITQNRVLKLYQDETKLIIAKDISVTKDITNELEFQFKHYKLEFKTLNHKEFDSLLREIVRQTETETEIIEINDNDDLSKLASDAPVVNLVNDIIINAIEKRSSDIHLEVFETYFQVRFRINGHLQSQGTYPKKIFEAVCARIKVLSKLDITQRRLAQDGKAVLNIYNNKIDIRTSTIPTIYGESIVLRLLGLEQTKMDLSSLGIDFEDISLLKKIISYSYGAFLLTGPTGSGKTTTLHALLNMLDHKIKNIITIEDPVEYTVDGINQIQINEKIGFSFGNVLRNILRQDPDIIMVGEMRDQETANLALRAAMTGHLVLSTLHTNDSISNITRLINMGVEKYIIESSVIAAAAQRLIRVLCNECKIDFSPSQSDRELFAKYRINVSRLFKPQGCPLCNHTGFIGRKGVFEIFEMNETIRNFIINNDSVSIIRKYLQDNGFKSMFFKGLKGCSDGFFYIEEIKSSIGEIK